MNTLNNQLSDVELHSTSRTHNLEDGDILVTFYNLFYLTAYNLVAHIAEYRSDRRGVNRREAGQVAIKIGLPALSGVTAHGGGISVITRSDTGGKPRKSPRSAIYRREPAFAMSPTYVNVSVCLCSTLLSLLFYMSFFSPLIYKVVCFAPEGGVNAIIKVRLE